MQARRLIHYGALGGFLLVGLACAGNSAGKQETTAARDTTIVQDTAAYRAFGRDTAVTDSSKWAAKDSLPTTDDSLRIGIDSTAK